ncbi:1-(5-phosphoribosyl)-5-((5-phosphoribosylamino)methylideneamino)imidazole-4-carboxamide isomerase [Methanothermobacter thermautotrophicus]|jgi:phosphoribosylformimino-5-aminoimidazole carboxamide ribotide isomerase|uniref:1-(5-phosphoribosyl)-5-[(5-phosphoribosylamino)methylideneamino] imidazole-4-carboxamide isomerase n=1 Tax=Methanothermobacter thermautotrophicus TaxID=145262 RepID=A0A842YM99_METTF|nr:1-(5-phosphoribosyl)-5-[(5-phosphoribosylamino)methylideneamino]imidazole-4-carboxamide isomerase [Methanothermobacter thermautotrophicus]MBE2900519.1 1-(5-phosphoribosyl)-5-((5-phosphoribosylamino)methylideneamino)imidazole-4-carboxamide isomerase [Methanothermobacter thermautotrophicus]MCQ8905366.1 1-(5-phosphoribosyl)-5-[(5-phosphoribosylamino)methylideneamino]imidazole-4-carboxamide isomerase [Methanothermobacter sp.]
MSFHKNRMLIIPAVDIKDGKCVQLVQGKPGTEQVVLDDPAGVARNWESLGAETVHVVDLDGALGLEKNTGILKEIIDEVSVPLQIGGGIRSKEYAGKLLDMGFERVILGTMAIENPEVVEELAAEYGSERIMVSLDSRDSRVVIRGWTEKVPFTAEEMARKLKARGAGSILFTNVDFEGLLSGFDLKPVTELVDAVDIPVIYSGGVSSLDDIGMLQGTGVRGVVIGSAIYRGLIDFTEALKYQDIE